MELLGLGDRFLEMGGGEGKHAYTLVFWGSVLAFLVFLAYVGVLAFLVFVGVLEFLICFCSIRLWGFTNL